MPFAVDALPINLSRSASSPRRRASCLLKTTSLAVTAAGTELFSAATNIFNANYQTIPLLIVASIWYLVMTSGLYVGQYYLERYFGRGSSRELPPTPLQRLRSALTR